MAMTRKRVKAVIQLRRALESEWIEKNPILSLGEPAFSTDVNKLKVGDGVKHWLELDYIGVGYEAGDGIVIENGVISLGDFIIDCGTSTTNIGGGS